MGNIVGGLAGYYSRKPWSRTLDTIAMIVRPQPYYIFAFALLLLMGYAVQWFPVAGGTELGRKIDAHREEVLREAGGLDFDYDEGMDEE